MGRCSRLELDTEGVGLVPGAGRLVGEKSHSLEWKKESMMEVRSKVNEIYEDFSECLVL